jgi:hypothetical protein
LPIGRSRTCQTAPHRHSKRCGCSSCAGM